MGVDECGVHDSDDDSDDHHHLMAKKREKLSAPPVPPKVPFKLSNKTKGKGFDTLALTYSYFVRYFLCLFFSNTG